MVGAGKALLVLPNGTGGYVSAGGGGGVESVVAGTGISVDNTDPLNPIVSAVGGGLTNSIISPTTSNVTAAVGMRYIANISGLTADRNFVLLQGFDAGGIWWFETIIYCG